MIHSAVGSRGFRRRRKYTRARPRRSLTTSVRRIVDAELKKFDLAAGPLAVPTITGQMVNLTAIGQGDTNVLRTGNWVRPVNIHGYCQVSGNSVQSTNQSQVRIGVLCWNNDFSADPPTVALIAADSSNPMCPFSLDNKGSYSVLWTRVLTISNNDASSGFQKMYKFYIRLGRQPKMLYDGATQKKYQYFFFAWSDIAAAGDEPFIDFCSSIRFTDS